MTVCFFLDGVRLFGSFSFLRKSRFLSRLLRLKRNGDTVVAVVVPFNSDEEFGARLDSYASQVSRVIVVDNSTLPEARARIAACAQSRSFVELIQNSGNLGLVAAQNIGIRWALESYEPDWILFMDDDSLVPEQMVPAMLQAWRLYPKDERVGMIVPRVIDRESDREGKIIVREGPFRIRRRRCDPQKKYCDTALTAIASGSLVNVTALRECGLFLEKYFIDSVDIEFSLRLRARGWRILVPFEAKLYHRLGSKTHHRLLGVPFTTTNHAVWRRYTMYRNRIDVWRNYIAIFPAYVFYDFLVSFFEAFKILLFENKKKEKMAAIGRGVKDGLAGRFPRPVP